jgi:hypothetical protein
MLRITGTYQVRRNADQACALLFKIIARQSVPAFSGMNAAVRWQFLSKIVLKLTGWIPVCRKNVQLSDMRLAKITTPNFDGML